jgi:hypothetical protein
LEFSSSPLTELDSLDSDLLSTEDEDGLDVAPEFKEPEPVKGMNING